MWYENLGISKCFSERMGLLSAVLNLHAAWWKLTAAAVRGSHRFAIPAIWKSWACIVVSSSQECWAHARVHGPETVAEVSLYPVSGKTVFRQRKQANGCRHILLCRFGKTVYRQRNHANGYRSTPFPVSGKRSTGNVSESLMLRHTLSRIILNHWTFLNSWKSSNCAHPLLQNYLGFA